MGVAPCFVVFEGDVPEPRAGLSTRLPGCMLPISFRFSGREIG